MLAAQKTEIQGGRGDDTHKQSDGEDKKRKRDTSVHEDQKGEDHEEEEGKQEISSPSIGFSTKKTKSEEQTSLPTKQPNSFVLPTKRYELSKMSTLANVARVIEGQEPVTKSLIPKHIEPGVLIPLKTTLELRDDHRTGHMLITRSPIRSTSAVINLLRDMLPEEIVKGMPHLRRCAKPADLPAHLKTQFMNETAQTKQIHTGKSNWVYVMLGLEATLSHKEMSEALSKLEGFEDGVFLASIPVPLLAPTSQVQAALWTSQFWPTMYRKNNPLGPHPSMVNRATDEIADDAPIWMSLAHDMAVKSKESGNGEAMGACIVYRGEDGPRLVAVAGDARWRHQPKSSKTGNPMAHATLRAVSMVAQKLVRAEKRNQRKRSVSSLNSNTNSNSENERPGSSGNVSHTLSLDNKPVEGSKAEGVVQEDGENGATSADGQDEVVCQVHNEVQDRVRDRLSQNRDRGTVGHRQRLAFEVFQDKPLMEEEDRIFMEEHPTPDGYLCHGLELYVTHEPCAMCSMAILHSRMGKVIFAKRMPLTGGLSAEDRVITPASPSDVPVVTPDSLGDIPSGEGIHGLGLFWRRELNWSMLAWEWEAHCSCKPLEMDPTTHA